MRALYRRVEGLNGILLILYLYIVAMIFLFLQLGDRMTAVAFAVASLAVLAVLCAVCPRIIRRIQRLHIHTVAAPEPDRRRALWFLGFFAVPCAIFLARFILRYPGIFTADSRMQLAEATSGNYTDWHPALHTLLAFTLPLKLTGVKGSIVLFQIIEYSLALAYASGVIRRHFGWRWAVVAQLVTLLFPYTHAMILRPYKDVALAICALLAMTYVLQIYMTGGAWLERPLNVLLFAAVLTVASIVRHNAILLTLPLLAGAILYVRPRVRVRIVALFLLLFLLVKFPLYAALGVQKPGERATEMLGLPMTVIGNVVVEHPESLDEESRAFVYSFATQEEWEQYYRCGSFNEIKFEIEDHSPIERAGTATILGVTWRCFCAEPASALRGLFHLTKTVYLPYYWLGLLNLLLLLLITGKLRLGRGCDCKRLILSLAPLVYNFGSMLLLSGYLDRIFYYMLSSFPILVLLLCFDREDNSAEVDSQ